MAGSVLNSRSPRKCFLSLRHVKWVLKYKGAAGAYQLALLQCHQILTTIMIRFDIAELRSYTLRRSEFTGLSESPLLGRRLSRPALPLLPGCDEQGEFALHFLYPSVALFRLLHLMGTMLLL
jgi:hypothetical protein